MQPLPFKTKTILLAAEHTRCRDYTLRSSTEYIKRATVYAPAEKYATFDPRQIEDPALTLSLVFPVRVVDQTGSGYLKWT